MTDYDVIQMGLALLSKELPNSKYDDHMKEQLKLRLNRIIAGIISDGNPEGVILDNYIIGLGLNLLILNCPVKEIRDRAEQMMSD